MIPVKVQKISYYHPSRSYAVILQEIKGDRKLPVLVGAFEAQAIAMALEYMEPPRPLTHDLIVNLIKGIGSNLAAIRITGLKDGIFYSVLDLRGKTIGHRKIDSRPSDALAIALRLHVPILVAEEVMEAAAVLEPEDEKPGSLLTVPKIEKLEEQLERAIEEEEYEIAARIRDKIKDLNID